MNQYRCETCDKDCVYANQTPTDELFYCQKFEYDWVRKFTSVKGCTTHSDFQSERDKVLTEKRIDYLRSLGWMVAVHNDYKQNGEFHTFWLLTYPDGKYLKGEGKTDEEALEQIVEELRQAGEP